MGAAAGVMGQHKKTFYETYTKGEYLGKGQYAVVHKATRKDDGAECAVKIIDKAALTAEDLAALEVEVEAMKILSDHPNFVKLYDFFPEKDYFYLCMELITGGELFDRICQKEKYTEREAREIILQMTRAVAHAHSRGVVHRDLKPENILLRSLDSDTGIKLADLGFAKIVSGPMSPMTTPCGTPGYVAPEILSGKPYTMRVDIWSLGVIFFILLCGYPPFVSEKDDQKELFELIKAARYEFDPAEWGAITDHAKDLISHILVADPEKRYTAAQILAHPWMQLESSQLPDAQLGATIQQLKSFNARRRLKGAVNAVRAGLRVKLLLSARSGADGKSGVAAGGSPLTAALAAARAAKDKEGQVRSATTV